MLIGSDMDGVTADFITPFLSLVNERAGTHYQEHDVAEWQLAQCLPGVSQELVGRLLQEFADDGGYRRLESIKRTLHSYRRLAGDGHHLFYISSRPKSLEEETIDWLKEHQFPDYHLVKHTKNKARMARQYGVRVFVEDTPKDALDLARKGIKVYLLDRPWNQDPIGVTRIKEGMKLEDHIRGMII